jgi:hypothetical protein
LADTKYSARKSQAQVWLDKRCWQKKWMPNCNVGC